MKSTCVDVEVLPLLFHDQPVPASPQKLLKSISLTLDTGDGLFEEFTYGLQYLFLEAHPVHPHQRYPGFDHFAVSFLQLGLRKVIVGVLVGKFFERYGKEAMESVFNLETIGKPVQRDLGDWCCVPFNENIDYRIRGTFYYTFETTLQLIEFQG